MMIDHELYRRWVEGDREAGSELVARHWESLYRHIEGRVGPTMAGDISQATWLAAQRSGTYRGGNFTAWMKAIARNQIARQRRERALALDRGSQTSPSRHLLRQEAAAAVEQLPSQLSQAARMYYVEGRPVAEIAKLEGVPVKTAWSRIRIAVERVRERLA